MIYTPHHIKGNAHALWYKYRLYNEDEGYTTESEARGRVYSMTPNPNCITGLYQNTEAFPLPIGSSGVVQ